MAHLAAVVEYSDDAIVSKSLTSIIQTWNAGAERIFGYTREEAVGRPILMLIPPDRQSEEADILARIRRGERVDHFETIRVRKDGRLIDVSLTISPIKNSRGEIVGASKIARDITVQRRLEAERVTLLERERAARAEAERVSAMKDEFLATLSHELRTPINAVMGWAYLLRLRTNNDAELTEAIDVIERNTRIQVQLIDDLLDMSRIIAGKIRLTVQSVDLHDAVRGAVASIRLAAEAKDIRIQTMLDPVGDPIRGDPARIQQVLWNILSNAVKFTPKGGRIQVELRRIDSRVEIAVTDTGIGIRPEFLPHVFERFRQADSSTTRSFGGLGLGLSIVKYLVELHGGKVRAASPGEGKGTTITVELPVPIVHARSIRGSDDDPPRAVINGAHDHPSLDGIRVLVVDDEADARDLVLRLLKDCKADVSVASNAADALEMVRMNPPDLILSDIGMPGTDGYDFMRRVRALGATEGGRTPAAALTAFARAEDRTRALRAGFQTHVAKPVEPAELVAVVASLALRR